MKFLRLLSLAMCLILATDVDAQTTYGCNNANACNYDPATVYDVNLGCTFPGDACYDAAIDAPAHLNQDCQCVETVYGCTDKFACNYNQVATKDHGGCIYDSDHGNTSPGCWVCSQEITTEGNQVKDGQGVLQDNDINDNGVCDDTEVYGCMDSNACNYYGDATIGTVATHENAFNESPSPCEKVQFPCEFCAARDSSGRIFRFASLNWNGTEVQDPAVGDTIFFDQVTGGWSDAATGLPLPTIGVAQHPLYEVISNDENDNDTCDPIEIEGCRNKAACNYNPNATVSAEDTFNESDSTWTSACLFPDECMLCLLPNGTTFEPAPSPEADHPNLDLTSPLAVPDTLDTNTGECNCNGYVTDALGNCLLTTDPIYCPNDSLGLGHGICDDEEVHGCMDETACNYDAALGVNVDNGTCQLPGTCGCNDDGTTKNLVAGACNCDGHTQDEVGDCLASDDPSRCEADINNNSICDTEEVHGCTNPLACNWDPEAAISDGSCKTEDLCGECGGSNTVLPAGWCNCEGDTLDAAGVCGGHCELDSDGDGVCDDIDPCPDDAHVVRDLCGVCGGDGPVFNADTCGCYTLPTDPDAWCEPCLTDSDGYPKGKIQYPSPGYDCDGNCLSDEYDEFGNCIVSSNKVQTSLPDSLISANVSGNRFNIETNPQRMYQWMQNIQTLHERMSTHLDDGSLSGGSDTLTIDKAIINNGNLIVSGETDLGYLYVPDTDANTSENDSVSILTNLFVQGYARIKGTTFSDGGVNTTAIDLSGDMSIGGDLEVAGKVQMDSTLHILDSLSTETAFTIGAFNQIVMDSTGYIIADSVAIRRDLIVHDSLSVGGELVTIGSINVNHDKVVIDSSGFIHAKGYVTVWDDMNVKDSLTVDGKSTFNDDITIGSPAVGSSPANPASSTMNGALTVTGLSNLDGGLSSNGAFTHTGTSFSTNASPVYIGQNAHQIPGKINAFIGVPSPSDLIDEKDPKGTYQLYVDGTAAGTEHGMVVRVTSQNSSMATNYVTFMGSDKVVGRIEGEMISETGLDDAYQQGLVAEGLSVTLSVADLGLAIRQVVADGVKLAKEVAEVTASAIPGAGLTDSDVAESITIGLFIGVTGAELATNITALVASIVNMVGASVSLGQYINARNANIGVVYASGSGDYAEWIEKENMRLDFLPGEIVGVRGGKISYDTYNSDHNLVISTNPIVLGMMPEETMQDAFEKVAFMGQVPVRVQGEVEIGDYILPSGDLNGYGKAIAQNEIELDEIPQIVGVAWERGEDPYFNVVNASVGLGKSGMEEMVSIISEELDDLRYEIIQQVTAEGVGFAATTKRSKKSREKRQKNSLDKHERVPLNSKDLSSSLLQKPQMQSDSFTNEEYMAYVETELEKEVGTIFSELVEEEGKVTREDWIQAAEDFESQIQEIEAQIQNITITADELPDFSGLYNPENLPTSKMQEAIAAISVKVIDLYVQPQYLEPQIRKAIHKLAKENPGLDLEKAYPPGSNAEAQIIENLRKQVMDSMKNTVPYSHSAIDRINRK